MKKRKYEEPTLDIIEINIDILTDSTVGFGDVPESFEGDPYDFN